MWLYVCIYKCVWGVYIYIYLCEHRKKTGTVVVSGVEVEKGKGNTFSIYFICSLYYLNIYSKYVCYGFNVCDTPPRPPKYMC